MVVKMKYVFPLLFLIIIASCKDNKQIEGMDKEDTTAKVKFITLDPGHFHAALVQKTMYAGVDSTIHVYAPEGPEVQDFLSKIESYNTRDEEPTAWNVKTHFSDDYQQQMLLDKPGNVMVVAGKNSKKTDYILDAVKAGLNVYADKPMAINPEGYKKLKEAFQVAEKNGVMIYDIMTERFEVTTAMQKLLSSIPSVFGEMVVGTPEEPAISKESVHHFYKYVSGKPLVRPPWFFDVNEEGEGIVDVTTHLVDLVQWEAFPGEIIDTTDIEMVAARRWPTKLSPDDFKKVTKLESFPKYLDKDIIDNVLNVYCNGEMTYKIKGKHAKVSVIWNFQAPEGTGDTHNSIMRGTKCDLIIKQGKDENYKPTLYVSAKTIENFEASLEAAIANQVGGTFKGTNMEKISETLWKINIPDAFKIGHEAHFAQVTKNFLEYLEVGALPNWEVPNMKTKYYTTIEGYKMAMQNGQ